MHAGRTKKVFPKREVCRSVSKAFALSARTKPATVSGSSLSTHYSPGDTKIRNSEFDGPLEVRSYENSNSIRPETGRNPAGIQPKSGRSPAGIRPESGRKPAGIRPESGRNPAGIRPDSSKKLIVRISTSISNGFRKLGV